MKRLDERTPKDLRPVSFEKDFAPQAEGSVVISMGNTKVLCAATIEDEVPRWMKNDGKVGGWITAEYAMLPRSTGSRVRRERNGAKGRTQEIQRLIGRALRGSIALDKIGERTITIDCDVLNADGGTRTASVTGGYVALVLALQPLVKSGELKEDIFLSPVAAISAGMVGDTPCLDLCYEEDVAAEVDANFVMNRAGEIIEVQGTAEGVPISKEDFDSLFELSKAGILELIEIQKGVLG